MDKTWWDDIEEWLVGIIREVQEEEREACAEICNRLSERWWEQYDEVDESDIVTSVTKSSYATAAGFIRDMIRARGGNGD